jgi:hypothetical protein
MMAAESKQTVEEVAQNPVVAGRADKTPVVAIGATFLIIAIVFVLALGLAGLAYWLAG